MTLYFSDLHVLDLDTMEWTHLNNTSGASPSARAGHGFASSNNLLYVYGGWGISGDGPESSGSDVSRNGVDDYPGPVL